MKRLLLAATAAAGLALASAPASAGVIVHDTIPEFASITQNQGLNNAGNPVAANRSNIASMFDNNLNTIWSTGIGGSIDFVITPADYAITSGSVIELTFGQGRSGDREDASLFLGTNGGAFVKIGDLFNRPAGASNTTSVDPSVATVTAVVNAASQTTSFFLTVNSGTFNSLRLVDGSDARQSGDGFDIAELSVTSVPEPASMALFGAGLLGLGLARRKAA